MLKYAIMLLIAIAVFFAARSVMKSSRNGGCAGCDGCSGSCGKRAEGKKKTSCCQEK